MVVATVISASPSETPVNSPSSLTVTTSSLDDKKENFTPSIFFPSSPNATGFNSLVLFISNVVSLIALTSTTFNSSSSGFTGVKSLIASVKSLAPASIALFTSSTL